MKKTILKTFVFVLLSIIILQNLGIVYVRANALPWQEVFEPYLEVIDGGSNPTQSGTPWYDTRQVQFQLFQQMLVNVGYYMAIDTAETLYNDYVHEIYKDGDTGKYYVYHGENENGSFTRFYGMHDALGNDVYVRDALGSFDKVESNVEILNNQIVDNIQSYDPPINTIVQFSDSAMQKLKEWLSKKVVNGNILSSDAESVGFSNNRSFTFKWTNKFGDYFQKWDNLPNDANILMLSYPVTLSNGIVCEYGQIVCISRSSYVASSASGTAWYGSRNGLYLFNLMGITLKDENGVCPSGLNLSRHPLASNDAVKSFVDNYLFKENPFVIRGHIYIDPTKKPHINGGDRYNLGDIAGINNNVARAIEGAESSGELSPDIDPSILPEILPVIVPISPPAPDPNPDPEPRPERPDPDPDPDPEEPDPEPDPEDPDPDPEDPDPNPEEPEPDSWKKIQLKDMTMLFPFCIPFDVAHGIGLINDKPKDPVFEIPIHLEYGGSVLIDYTLVIDLTSYEFTRIWTVIRSVETLIFIIGLGYGTKKFIY